MYVNFCATIIYINVGKSCKIIIPCHFWKVHWSNELCIYFAAILSNKHDLINGANDATNEASSTPKNDNVYSKVAKQVLLIPGKIISMSILLNHKSTFRKQNGLTGKPLMERVLEQITTFSLGEVETYNISRNKTKVCKLQTTFFLFKFDFYHMTSCISHFTINIFLIFHPSFTH
jgi:hypothetical protein